MSTTTNSDAYSGVSPLALPEAHAFNFSVWRSLVVSTKGDVSASWSIDSIMSYCTIIVKGVLFVLRSKQSALAPHTHHDATSRSANS